MENRAQEAYSFLDKLVRKWELSGQMGAVPLKQSVEAKWILGGLFVQMYFSSTLPPPEGQKRYEAIYHIGYNAEQDRYVMHLLDTFGVALVSIPGIGQREGNSIPFVFAYGAGPFTNHFVYDADSDSWSFEQSQIREGQSHTFATKRMTRRS